MSNDVISREDVPFGGVKNKILYFDLTSCKEKYFEGNFRRNSEKFQLKEDLIWRTSRVNTPYSRSEAVKNWMLNRQI